MPRAHIPRIKTHSNNTTYRAPTMITKDSILAKDFYLIGAKILRDHSADRRTAAELRH